MSLPLHTILGAALDAARSALRELDADQVPNDLRRVAGYGGSLPPPLAKSLLRGLEQYEWLREQSSRQLPPEGGGDRGAGDRGGDDRIEAAVLYLERPDGWEIRLAEIAWATGMAAGEEIRRSAAARERDLAAGLKAAKARVKTAQRASKEAVAALERRVAELSAERRVESAGEARDLRDTARAAEAAGHATARLREERDAAVEEARAAREALAKERALRRRAEADAAGGAATGGWADDP
ncbi:MAG: hypothetical protein KJ956_08700, partial [Actinobacteria bacterium]|nr:hypothetical protein [Actinomycetota bacterium]